MPTHRPGEEDSTVSLVGDLMCVEAEISEIDDVASKKMDVRSLLFSELI